MILFNSVVCNNNKNNKNPNLGKFKVHSEYYDKINIYVDDFSMVKTVMFLKSLGKYKYPTSNF